VVCCAACNTQPPDSSAPPTRVATHGKQVASASEEWRALPKPWWAHNSFGTAGITNEIHMPAAQGGPRGGAVMDLHTEKWKMASTPLFPPAKL